jgi:hypothetical protein
MKASIPEFDLRKIKPINGDQRFGWEELSCQIAADEPRPPGARHYRKGPGADAGVECFTVLPNKNEIGWQAKFFDSFGSSQETQLDESIDQALEKHPNLTRYIVCIPIDLRDSRVGKGMTEFGRWSSWREKRIEAASRVDRVIEIDLWQASFIRGRLAEKTPRAAGRLAFFLGELNFEIEWLARKFESTKAALQQRYSPEYSVDLPIRKAFWGLSRSPTIEQVRRQWHQRVQSKANCLGLRNENIFVDDLRDETEKNLANLLVALSTAGEVGEAHPVDEWKSVLDTLLRRMDECVRACWDENKENTAERRSVLYFRRTQLHELIDVLQGLQRDLASETFRFVNEVTLLVHGDAGAGKSHLLADVTEECISRGHPAIMLLTSSFTSAHPGPQILAQLDLTAHTFEEFLSALNAAGRAAGVRSLLLIDALNERHGIELWRENLTSFIQQLKQFPYVALCLACRSTYLEAIFPNALLPTNSPPRIKHVGFASDGGDASRIYLAKRGIAPFGGPTSLTELTNPLFLKACCDALEREGKTALPAGSQSLTKMLNLYLSSSYSSIEHRMNFDRRARVVERGVEALVGLMVNRGSGYLPLADALAALERIHPSNHQGDQSLLIQLEREGVITVEAVGSDPKKFLDEELRFTFERISDLRIASSVLERHIDSGAALLNPPPGSQLHVLLTSATLWEKVGLLEALSLLLPEKHGIEILDVVVKEGKIISWELGQAFQESLLLREQRTFSDRTHELILAQHNGNTQWQTLLLAVATEPDNKFNALYLHDQLWPKSMPERDATWSAFLATEEFANDGPAVALINWAIECGADNFVEEGRAELAGITLAWFFATSHRALRDKATKALSSLLRPRMELADSLLRRFVQVDDPYVLERVLGSIYGAVLHSSDAEGIGRVAATIVAAIFKHRRPLVHFLIRDYASGIVAYAKHLGCLPSNVDLRTTTPPWQSELTLRQITESELACYTYKTQGMSGLQDQISRSASSEWTGDFAKYVIAPSMHYWWATSITEPLALSCSQQCERWSLSLNRERDTLLLDALDKIYAFCLPTGKAETDNWDDIITGKIKLVLHTQTDENEKERKRIEAEFALLEANVIKNLDLQGRLIYELFVGPYLNQVRHRLRDDLSANLSPLMAQRWITVRAHELGWKEELHGPVDAILGRRSSRGVHSIERIGKKYQWIALHELLARVADNLIYANRYESPERGYEGAWQTSRRDIDPSLLINRAEIDDEKGSVWWSPVSTNIEKISAAEQATWLRTEDDLLNSANQLEVTDPEGRQWFVLHNFVNFSTAMSTSSHVDTWCRIWCIAVRDEDLERVARKLARQFLIDPNALPRREITETYLGEYSWHPALNDADNWNELEYGLRMGSPLVLPTSVSYRCESGGYDHSIDETVNLELPERWILKALRLRLSDRNGIGFVDEQGMLVAQDPSIRTAGPTAALIDKMKFVELLKREGLSPIWVIAGEKGAYGADHGSFVGRQVHSAVYIIDSEGTIVQRKRNIRFE